MAGSVVADEPAEDTGDVAQHSRSTGRFAITFDDGPDPESTLPVLDRLDDLGVAATFFCLGSMAVKYPDIVREIDARGHDIGVHGYDHMPHLLRSPRWVCHDVLRAKAEMESIGITVRWFRPPYGVISGTTLAVAKYSGMDIVLWSAWGREWTTADAGEVRDRITGRLGNGVIVLMHDADTASPAGTWRVAYDALPMVIQAASDHKLQPVTLSALLD
jgi:peptidoglycan/xylan/chitin deacetylase (PgdA/CDA1 family)